VVTATRAALYQTGLGALPSDDVEDLVQGGSMSNGRITRERKEREGGSFTGGELYQRRRKQRGWHWVELVLGRRESVCGSEREKTRVMPGLNTRREAKGKRERKMAAGGLAIDGRRLCGVKEK
jgi:hypothetical protein